MKETSFGELLTRSKKLIDWLAIHDYPSSGSQSSELIGEIWKESRPWKEIAEGIYQPLELNLFKFVLFSEVFSFNHFPVIVKLIPSNKLKLIIRQGEGCSVVEIHLKDHDNTNLESLYRTWDEFNKRRKPFTANELSRLLPYLDINPINPNHQGKISDILKSIPLGEIPIVSFIRIPKKIEKAIKYVFIGSLLWPWRTLVYETLRTPDDETRIGMVFSLMKRIKPEKFITTPEFYQIYIKGLHNTWVTTQRELLDHATRAAISQVMARNMSHNFGSHVLSKIIQWFQLHDIVNPEREWQLAESYEPESGSKKLFDDIQEILSKFKTDSNNGNDSAQTEKCIDSILELIDRKESTVYNTYLLLAAFFSYLKARMDYLADVTTNTPVIENPQGIYNDLVKTFIQNRVLNDRISGIEKFRYKIVLCRPDRHNGIQMNRNGQACKHAQTTGCFGIITATNDIPVSIPNDVLGSHAFYTILENIIRNTAKHGSTPEEGCTEFKVKIEEADLYKYFNTGKRKNRESSELDWNEFYAVSVFDNCDLSREGKSKIGNWTEEKKIKAGLKKNRIRVSRVEELVANQNEKLNKSILEDNKLRHGAWGLIEMDASAAYLRKIDVELIDSDRFEITDLSGKNPVTKEGELAILQAYAEQEKYLGYRFFLRKPQEVLIIADPAELSPSAHQDKQGNRKALSDSFKNSGVWIFTKKSFLNLDERKVFPHKLVVVMNPDQKSIHRIASNSSCYTKRVLYRSGCLDLPEEASKEFILNLWIDYYKKTGARSYEGETYHNTFKPNGLRRVDDMHGKNYCKYFNEHKKYYIEISTSATKHFIWNELSDEERKSTGDLHKLRERASEPIKILLIDERIQQFAGNRYSIRKNPECKKGEEKKGKEKKGKEKSYTCFHSDGVPYRDIYERTNIDVPERKKCDLNIQDFQEKGSGKSTEYDKIIKHIQEFIKGEMKADHEKEPHFFVVIHLGIIEKLIRAHHSLHRKLYDKDDKKRTKDFVENILLNKNQVHSPGKEDLSRYYDNIVVTSGRGTPQNIPQGIRYLNFSVITQYLITLRNKYAFTEALYSARGTN